MASWWTQGELAEELEALRAIYGPVILTPRESPSSIRVALWIDFGIPDGPASRGRAEVQVNVPVGYPYEPPQVSSWSNDVGCTSIAFIT
jgi:ubiquitin-protein ligase